MSHSVSSGNGKWKSVADLEYTLKELEDNLNDVVR